MATAGAAAAVGMSLAGTVPAGAGVSWVGTATRALTPAQASDLGSAPGQTPMRVSVGLAMPNRAGLDRLIRAQRTPGSGQYRHFLAPGEFAARFAPSVQQAQTVADYLRHAGFRDVAVAPNRLQVTANGTAGQAEHAFNTRIERFSQRGKVRLANTQPARVPAALAGIVTGVGGLSSFTMHPDHQAAGAPKLTGYYPKEFQTVYDAGGTPTGAGTEVAVISAGNMKPTIGDLRTAESQQHLPRVPVSVIHTGPTSPDTSGRVEWDLDSQTSTGIAQTVKRLDFYDATSLSDADLTRAINAFAAQDQARAGSASLGECDTLAQSDGSQVLDDAALAQAAAQGQSFFASSGDTGASCPILPTNGIPDSGPVDTSYPASSPYATAVGGTTLNTDAQDHYQGEITWNAGGGGASPVEAPGFWQKNADPAYATGQRGVPDIAFDADPNTGARIYQGNSTVQVGGTSLSSPLALGAWARLESGHGNSLGFAPTALYGLYNKANTSPLSRNATPGFHDITTGFNGLYPATPGWDFTTGIGSFDLTTLAHYLY